MIAYNIKQKWAPIQFNNSNGVIKLKESKQTLRCIVANEQDSLQNQALTQDDEFRIWVEGTGFLDWDMSEVKRSIIAQ